MKFHQSMALTSTHRFYQFLLFFFFYKELSAAAESVCRTPNGAEGVCVPVKRCQLIYELFNIYGDDPPKYFKDFLAKSRCAPERNEVYICCRQGQVLQQEPAEQNWGPLPKSQDDSELDSKGVQILMSLRCGLPNDNRISGGNVTRLNELPWMALLRYSTPEDEFRCAGTLITQHFVLTAAHCVNSARLPVIGVRLGEYEIGRELDCQQLGSRVVCAPPVQDYDIERIFIHPQHNARKRLNDIALIRILGTATLQVHIRPICLPVTERSKSWEAEDDFLISGWGRTETGERSLVPLKAAIRLWNNSVCQSSFRVSVDPEKHICAGDLEHGRDSCKGDSGGPMFQLAPYTLNKRYVQYGIVSFGGSVCSLDERLPGFYTNVLNYMPWITKTVAEHS